MELTKRERNTFLKVNENLALLNRLAFVYGVRGVLDEVAQKAWELNQAYVVKDDKMLLVSAVKLASRAIPDMAALVLPRLVDDLRCMVMENKKLNHLKQYEVLSYDIKRLASML